MNCYLSRVWVLCVLRVCNLVSACGDCKFSPDFDNSKSWVMKNALDLYRPVMKARPVWLLALPVKHTICEVLVFQISYSDWGFSICIS